MLLLQIGFYTKELQHSLIWKVLQLIKPIEMHLVKGARAWRETTPVCSGRTRLVRAGYSRHDSGASRERARITQRVQDGSVHMQRSPAPITPGRL